MNDDYPVRECGVKVLMQFATYTDDDGIKDMVHRFLEHLNEFVRDDPNFISNNKPIVEVFYDPRT